MSWPQPIQDLRVRIGLQPNDATRDMDLSVASDLTLQIVELYLDRKLLFREYVEWADCSYPSFLVKAWPIDRGFGVIQSDGAIPDLKWIIAGSPFNPSDNYVAPTLGGSINTAKNTKTFVVPWSPWAFPSADGSYIKYYENEVHVDWEKGIIYHTHNHPYQVAYYGGFRVMPKLLVWSLLTVFDAVWASDSSLGGTTGGGIIQGSGAIKKVSLVGIGSVDLDVGATVTDSGGSNSGAPWGLIPSTARTILDRFRRESAVGVG